MSAGRAFTRAGFVFGLIAAFACAALPALAPARSAPSSDSAAAPPSEGEASIERPVGFVTDFAGVMDDAARARLEAFLVQVREKTGSEIAVLTVRTTEPESPEAYKTRVFRSWNLGREDLLMLVAIEQRRVVFETGYDLEGVLPDGLQSRLFRQEMRDRFRAGDFAGGITAGAVACARRIAADKQVTLEWNGRELRYDRVGGGPSTGTVILIVALLMIAMIVVGSVSQARRSGMPYRRRRSRDDWGGWGGWGGGFGGGGFGGGSSGGGGSFGGFGGGSSGSFSSGGGGGGGSW